MGAEWTGEFLGMWPCYEVGDICLWDIGAPSFAFSA